MYSINRSIAIIKPKKPFIAWANHVPDADREYIDEVFTKDCTLILIPEYDTEKQAKQHINEMWADIFKQELYGWCTNEAWWPQERNQKMFWQWFSEEFHSEVLDPYNEEIIKEEW